MEYSKIINIIKCEHNIINITKYNRYSKNKYNKKLCTKYI